MDVPAEDLKGFSLVSFALLVRTSVRALFLVHFHFDRLENQETLELRLGQRSDTGRMYEHRGLGCFTQTSHA